MHPNPAFRGTPEAASLAFAAARGFGTLAVNGPAGPLLSHVPFLLSDDGRTAELHLVRTTAIARRGPDPAEAVLSVTGPEGYVSPDWYGLADQVPTWNYVAVHLRGTLTRLPQDALRGLLDRLSDAFEERLAPKPAWKTAKMPEDLMARMMRQILPYSLEIAEVQSTWKLGQNKPEAARLAAAGALEEKGETALATLMRQPPGEMDSGSGDP